MTEIKNRYLGNWDFHEKVSYAPAFFVKNSNSPSRCFSPHTFKLRTFIIIKRSGFVIATLVEDAFFFSNRLIFRATARRFPAKPQLNVWGEKPLLGEFDFSRKMRGHMILFREISFPQVAVFALSHSNTSMRSITFYLGRRRPVVSSSRPVVFLLGEEYNV